MSKVTEEQASALLGKMSDARLAEILGVEVEEVRNERERRKIPEVTGVEEAGDETPPKKTVKKPEPAPPPKKAEPAPPKKAEPAPPSVRVIRSARVFRPNTRRTWRLGRGDVYSQEQAAYLWEQHRELVEPYPPSEA